MDLVEQIDLTVNPPLWGAIDRRNRVVCEPAPLIYYHPAREREPVPESSTAMGSRDSAEVEMPGETGVENASPATVATVPPETPVTEGTDIVMDDEMSQQKHLELVAIDSELEKAAKEILDRLGREQLPHFVGDEQIPAFESRVQEWINNLPADQKDDGGVVATLLVAGAVRKADVNERFALEAQKSHRLKMAAEAEAKAKELLKKQLAEFDVAKYLVESTKDQRIFYEKVQKLLEDLKTAIEEPMTLDPKILPELGNVVKDLSKMMDGNAGMHHHYLGTIQSMVKQVESLSWEMSGQSIDRRAIPAWDKSSTSKIMKESAREVMAGIRWNLQEMGHMLREQGLVQDKQLTVQDKQLTVLSDLAASAQRTAEVLEMINEREAKHQDAMEKKKADKAMEEQKKMDAARLRSQKEQAEKDRIAQEEAEKKRALQAELDSANAGIEAAQKRAKMAQEAMAQTPTTPVRPPMMPAMPVGPVGYGQPGYGQPCGQPCFMGGMGVMPQQGFPLLCQGNLPCSPLCKGYPPCSPRCSQPCLSLKGNRPCSPNMPGTGHQAPL